jgi:hypothetical protein
MFVRVVPKQNYSVPAIFNGEVPHGFVKPHFFSGFWANSQSEKSQVAINNYTAQNTDLNLLTLKMHAHNEYMEVNEVSCGLFDDQPRIAVGGEGDGHFH